MAGKGQVVVVLVLAVLATATAGVFEAHQERLKRQLHSAGAQQGHQAPSHNLQRPSALLQGSFPTAGHQGQGQGQYGQAQGYSGHGQAYAQPVSLEYIPGQGFVPEPVSVEMFVPGGGVHRAQPVSLEFGLHAGQVGSVFSAEVGLGGGQHQAGGIQPVYPGARVDGHAAGQGGVHSAGGYAGGQESFHSAGAAPNSNVVHQGAQPGGVQPVYPGSRAAG